MHFRSVETKFSGAYFTFFQFFQPPLEVSSKILYSTRVFCLEKISRVRDIRTSGVPVNRVSKRLEQRRPVFKFWNTQRHSVLKAKTFSKLRTVLRNGAK